MPVESGITALAQRVGLEIKTLKAASIVADVVACYDNTSTGHAGTETDILHYDVTNLTDKDVVLVLKDEEHDSQKSYYRYNAAGTNLVFEIAEDKVDHPIATLTTFGAVKPDGSTISISDGVISYTLPTATASRLGGVKIAADGGLQITTAGVLSVKASALPIASNTTLGAVKIKSDGGLEITSAGELSVKATALPIATTTTLGAVKVDGTTITVTADGTLTAVGGSGSSSIPIASRSVLGGVIIGDGLNITDTGALSVNLSTVSALNWPIATADTKGILQVEDGTGLVISDGVLSFDFEMINPTTSVATSSKIGLVKPDNDTLHVEGDGTLYVDLSVASYDNTGVVKFDDTSSGLLVDTSGVVTINAQAPLVVENNVLKILGYTEEVWELTMEDGSTVKRTFLSKVTS